MSQQRHLPALFLSLACTVLLVCAFVLPFLESSIDLEFPGWVATVDRFIPGDTEARLEEWILSLTGVPLGEQFLFGIIAELWSTQEYLLAIAIFLFSAVFPVMKLLLALLLSSGTPMGHATRRKVQKVLDSTAKWSMADVFIAAMVVVFFKAEGFQFEFAPRAGITCFAIAAIGSSVAVHLLKRQSQVVGDRAAGELMAIAGDLRASGLPEGEQFAARVEHLLSSADYMNPGPMPDTEEV